MSLRVGIDYLPAVTHWPGVGRYARELVRALVRLDEAPLLSLFEFGAEARTIGEPAIGLEGFEARYRRRSVRLPRRALHAVHALTGLGADSLAGHVPIFHRILLDSPSVARAVQTLAVGELPPRDSSADHKLGTALTELDHLFVASRHAERELHERYGISTDRIHFVSLGCDHWRRDLPIFGAPTGKPDLIVLGAIREERRQLEILRAFEELEARGIVGRLVLVGGGPHSDSFRAALDRSPAREAVDWIDSPVEADLPRLVSEASVLVHLSRGEETAVTPLEAFSFGTAVLTNPGGAFEEALGTAAHYFDSSSDVDVTELVKSIELAVETAPDEGLRAKRQAIAAEYTWEASARRTARIWREIATGC